MVGAKPASSRDKVPRLHCQALRRYGHRFKFCFTRARPISWRPKSRDESERSELAVEDSGSEGEESTVHSISSPNCSFATENPSSGDVSTIPLPDNPCSNPTSPEFDLPEADMANFVVDPTPFIPEGLEVEEWARPARGRIVISGNPPHRHEEYSIVSFLSHPPQHLLYDTMDEVVDFFEEVHQANNMEWEPWSQQGGEGIGENEIDVLLYAPPMRSPAPSNYWNFVLSATDPDIWLLSIDNPTWATTRKLPPPMGQDNTD
nr:unnamed protein product [Digitaria exilis]